MPMTLEYAGQLVAMGTMGYKHESMAGNGERTTAMLAKTQLNLKLIPGVDGCPAICQLVAYNLTDISIKGSWDRPGRLHLVPHVNAPVADFPVRKIVGAHHFLADLTLPYGRASSMIISRSPEPGSWVTTANAPCNEGIAEYEYMYRD
jgi:acetoacetate decarboxylase